jgi:hypothetical protein
VGLSPSSEPDSSSVIRDEEVKLLTRGCEDVDLANEREGEIMDLREEIKREVPVSNL